jgi:hypothetical protein
MSPLDRLLQSVFSSEWRVIVILTVVLLGLAEVGFRFGLSLHSKKDEARKSQIGGVQGTIFGILGLLLGFTFAMSVSRYEARRTMVLTEANVIGTTFLRADFLPPAHRDEVKKLLREYVDVRLQLHPAGADLTGIAPELRRSAEIEAALWEHAKAVAAETPTPITATFITTLNDMIDTDSIRQSTFRNRIPGGVWLLLALVAAFGCFTCGYGSGSQGERSSFTNVVLPLLIAIVITLIFDLMHSESGVIGISQQPLLDLKTSIAEPTH